ncbi:MAG: hypothetical protein ACO3IJ_11870 [Steroidobacteraceae bacterium]
MLTGILTVTLAVPDLVAMERAYVDTLGFTVEARGVVSRPLARAWQAVAVEGREWVLLRPAGGSDVFLRIIHQPSAAGYRAMRSWGWNANEILIQDPLATRSRLENSAFKVIGEPRGLSLNPEVIAMQAIGPAGELVYLTRIPPGRSLFNLGTAQAAIDRTFIVVLGGPDMSSMRNFYARQLGMPVTEAALSTISVLAREWGLESERQFPLSIVRFPADFLVEIDEYPAEAGPRPVLPGELPPGIAMVTFTVTDLGRITGLEHPGPTRHAEAPYLGRRASVLRGMAGEWIELVESVQR